LSHSSAQRAIGLDSGRHLPVGSGERKATEQPATA
jgi:hypothetical protein